MAMAMAMEQERQRLGFSFPFSSFSSFPFLFPFLFFSFSLFLLAFSSSLFMLLKTCPARVRDVSRACRACVRHVSGFFYFFFKSDTQNAYPDRIQGVSGRIRVRYARDTDTPTNSMYPCFIGKKCTGAFFCKRGVNHFHTCFGL